MDCYFDDPIEAAAKRYHQSSEWQAVQKVLSGRRGKALDVGAGRGISSYALAKDGWDVTALEPDPSHLVGAGAIRSLAEVAGVTIQVVENWGESLPFPNESFDLVYGRQVLHHANDLKAFCREIGRVLRPGGVFLASREHVISKLTDLQRFLDRHPLHRLYGGENAYQLSEYTDAIRNGGIRITRILNPWASDINLFPHTYDELSQAICDRTRIVPKRVLTPAVLARLGKLYRTPGALYSFVGIRKLS